MNSTIYAPADLARVRKETNERAIHNITRARASPPDNVAMEESSLNANANDYLTVEEELQLVNYFVMTLSDICFDLGEEVVYIAAMFFREFFVHNSVMDYAPSVALFTCLLVAVKAKEGTMAGEEFLITKMRMKGIENKVPQVLAMECDVMIALDGMLHRETPFIILEYFRSAETVIEANIILKIIVSDISLVHDASTIALACHNVATGKPVADERYERVKDKVEVLAKEMSRLRPVYSDEEMARLNGKAKTARAFSSRKKRKKN